MKQDTKPFRPIPIFKPTSQRNDSTQHEPSGQHRSESGLCFNHIDMEERIVLVDKNDKEVGTEEKMKAHKEGKLHRAFSVFVFNSKGEKLLQRRAKTKYHSGGLWTNTCCSHPRPGEPAKKAAHRRLKEEMGFDCELKEVFNFTYHAKLDKNLFEHEYDHVFVGKFEGEPNPNPEEIDDWKWIGLEELKRDIQENPDSYTYWLREIFDKAISHLKDNVKLG